MASFLFCIALAAVGEPGAAANTEQPGFHEYQRKISELFRQEQPARTSTDRAAAVRSLCELHRQIVRDSRYETSDVLKEYRARLWSRLTKVKSELKQHLAREGKAGKESLDDLAALERASPLSASASDSLAESLSLLYQTQGGPAQMLGFGGGAFPNDNGLALVELIERTINPAFWDVNGGPGTIVYYAPLQCLVVRATSEVHGSVGGLVGGLREAGR